VRGDRIRLEQALGNLVDNALRHGAGTVSVVAEPAGDELQVHVRDEGPGFPEEFLPRAFERFTRPGQDRAGRGTGLGLSIVRTIAAAHGGTAGAVNGVRGADVWISLATARSTSPSPDATARRSSR
jgi:signal transduction histidine kinase